MGPVADSQKITFDEPQIGPAGRPLEIELSRRAAGATGPGLGRDSSST